MAVLQTGQSFSSGDQVTATKLQDIANLATFRTGANQTADDSTIQVDGSGGYLKVKSAGISSNELATNSVITAKIQDGSVTAAKLDSAAVSVLMPTATVLPYAGSTAPTGYLVCAGQSVLIADYGDLYGVIGITYGGSGSSFNLPDLRGRVIAGQDDMGGTSANRLTNQSGGLNGDTLGAAGGSETHTLTEAQMPSHTHDSGTITEYGPFIESGDASGGTTPQGLTTLATGGDQPHNNVQPTIILNYIIKT
jgi:microcystin-dependent protein